MKDYKDPANPVSDWVGRTLFTLPTEGHVINRRRENGNRLPAAEERDRILEAARKVRPARTKFMPPRGTRPPRPGTGEFNPEAGKPGSAVTVEIVVVDRKRWHTDKASTLFTVEREGCVMLPAPGGRVWVSLWDGRTPVEMNVDEDSRARITATEDEYRARFEESAAA